MQSRRSALALLVVAALTAGCAVSRQSPGRIGRSPAPPWLTARQLVPLVSALPVVEALPEQFIVRVAPGAIVTITAPTTAPTFTGDGSNVITTIAGTATAQAAITGCTWVNRANGATGSATGTNAWSISSVTLIVGTNAVAVTCLTALGGQGTAVLVVARPPPPAPTVTITAPSSSPTFDAGIATSITVSGTASTLDTIQNCTWTNSLGGSGTASGTATWSETVPLTVGSNVVVELCTDSLGQTGTDLITITRQLPALPVVTITAPTASPTFDAGTASTQTVAGTASTSAMITSCTWVNSLGGSGIATGTTTWTIANLPLTIGVNNITVTCSDQFSQSGNDIIAITRSAGGPSTNPISVTRQPAGDASSPNIAWATVGVVGGIPTRTTICATFSAGASEAMIESAINGCTANGVVFLNAGTYNLPSLEHHANNVTLRGAGNGTILRFTSLALGCGSGLARAINLGACDSSNYGCTSNCGGGPGPPHVATWTPVGATGSWVAAAGTTVLTLSTTTGLTVGAPIYIDQLNDTVDWPANGDIRNCDADGTCRNNGGSSYERLGRVLVEGHLVTSCGTSTPGAACTNTNVTISPGLLGPSFRFAQSPSAWWGNASGVGMGMGIENLTIDLTTGDGQKSAIDMLNCTNCYVKGVRIIQANAAARDAYEILTLNCNHCTVHGNYFYGPPTTGLVNIYAIAMHLCEMCLIENNILHSNSAAMVPNDSINGTVMAYNYIDEALGASIVEHGVNNFMLSEGNDGSNYSGDIIHGPHHFLTNFRNLWDSHLHNSNDSETESAVHLYSRNRFVNVVGNVLAGSYWTTYQIDCGAINCPFGPLESNSCQQCIYHLGWGGTSGPGSVPNDTRVATTLFRWGNYDNVTNTVRFVTAEVPTGLSSFAQPVPGSQTLPASLYLSAKPAWFGSIAWPPIGPDVSGGNLPNTGGHANEIPATACFRLAGNDPAYPSSNPRVKLNVASGCP